MQRTWWKEGVVYQIYPRSFYDSNNDGIGDIPGIIEKLDYIKSLGIDIIWLCPVYKSPNDDNGYDISDYRNIMDEFGTMADFDRLLEGVHDRDMKLIMDLVANHSSDEHFWFQESRKSKDNPYRDYYIWKSVKDGKPPTNWPSFFGGSTWEFDTETEEYYLHLFTKKQPDLNWENPRVRKEIYNIIKYWFEKGVDGFRMDVISLISKRPEYANAKSTIFGEIVENLYANGPRVHEYLEELNAEVLSDYDVMTVGEGPGITLDHCLDYVSEDRDELNMVFHFDHMFMEMGDGGRFDINPIDFLEFKKIFTRWDEKLKGKGWGSIFLGNHDFPRMVSRYGNDGEYWEYSSKLLTTLLMTMRGTPYTYQGDEIGMTNVAFSDPNDYDDVETLNYFKEAKAKGIPETEALKNVHYIGRDNARTPMQWSNAKNGGFTEGKPWLKINPNYQTINVEEQENRKNSILNYYRKIVQFRKDHPTLVYGDYESLQNGHPAIFAYRRWDDKNEFLILLNFSDQKQLFEEQTRKLELLINNYDYKELGLSLKPWEAKVFKILS